jgi:hypothetical protein
MFFYRYSDKNRIVLFKKTIEYHTFIKNMNNTRKTYSTVTVFSRIITKQKLDATPGCK